MSEPILAKARSGLYSDFEVHRGLSPDRLERWFTREGDGWRASPQLQQMVSFQTQNLLQDASALGRFDLIFCRNVLIYFDVDQKRRVLEMLHRALAADGALFLGGAETILGMTKGFEPASDARGLYRVAAQRMTRLA